MGVGDDGGSRGACGNLGVMELWGEEGGERSVWEGRVCGGDNGVV